MSKYRVILSCLVPHFGTRGSVVANLVFTSFPAVFSGPKLLELSLFLWAQKTIFSRLRAILVGLSFWQLHADVSAFEKDTDSFIQLRSQLRKQL